MSAPTLHPGDALLALLYGEVSAEEARRLQAHVDGCEECAATLAGYRAVRQAARALPRELPSARGTQALLLAAAQGAARARRRRATLWTGSLLASAAAAALALLALRPALPPEQPLAVASAPAAVPKGALAANEPQPAQGAESPRDNVSPGGSTLAKPARLKAAAAPTTGGVGHLQAAAPLAANQAELANKAEAPATPPPPAPAEVASARTAAPLWEKVVAAPRTLDAESAGQGSRAESAAAQPAVPRAAADAAQERAKDEDRLKAVRLRLKEATEAELLPLLLEECELEGRLGQRAEARVSCALVTEGHPGTPEAARARAVLERLASSPGVP